MREPQQNASDQGAVSVVICSHQVDRWHWLLAAVRSVERQTISVEKIVLVIDGNKDLAQLAADELSDACTVLARDECGGLSEARNSGLMIVTSPFVAFFDDDAEADEDWLERLMEPLADPNVLGVGGHSLPVWDAREPSWFPPELLWVVGCSYAGLPLEIAPVRNVFGGCAVYRRDLFRKYGGFLSELGRHQDDAKGCEEAEFCMRVSRLNPKSGFVYQPRAIIRHHVPAGRATVGYIARRSFADARSKTVLVAQTHRAARRAQIGTEMSYARRFVARAFFQDLYRASRGDRSGLAQAAVLSMSMAVAAGGFLAGLASLTHTAQPVGGSPSSRASGLTNAGVPHSNADRQRREQLDRSEPTRVCVVGSGWAFLSGISYHTCRMTNALADRYQVSAILMRRLLPRRLYPGSERVGRDLACLSYRDDVACFDGVDYYWVPSLLRALRFLREQRPDVVVFQWWSGTVIHSYLILALVARSLGARVVIEFHETLDTAEAAIPLARLYVRIVSSPLLRMSAGAAVHSEFDRDSVASRWGLRGKPIAVVPMGPYDHLLRLSETAQRGPADDSLCNLLFFGTIRPYKGLEHLIQAFDSLDDEQIKGFRLTVVGETWEGWTLPAELIETSRYRERIDFINRYVHDEEVAVYFGDADAIVLPYLRSSGSGPLQMAMSYGLPVVVTSVGGLPEAAAGYEGARFVEPAHVGQLRDAILDLRSMMGRRYEDPNSWSRSADGLAALFDNGGHR